MSDNPEFASQAGEHAHAALGKLQHLTPDAYDRRAAHSCRMAAAADHILNTSPSALALSPLQRAHAAAFIDGHDALGLAITCYPMHLLPLNSVGVGGVPLSFVETVEWMRFESVEDYDIYAGKVEAASGQVEEVIVAMREGMRRGWLQAAAVVHRVEEQVPTRARCICASSILVDILILPLLRSTQPSSKPPPSSSRPSPPHPAPCPPISTTASPNPYPPSLHPLHHSFNSSR
jgi:uncharacterized protein (DUF885 family)